MSLTSIEPRTDLSALREALNGYRDIYSALPHDGFEPKSNTPVLHLPAVAVATLHHDPITRPIVPRTRGIASESAMRLVMLDASGIRTAWSVAEELAEEMWPSARYSGFTRGLSIYRHVPRKGLDLIRGMDALDLVPWFCDVPDPDDWRRFERVRLRDALARLPRRQRASVHTK